MKLAKMILDFILALARTFFPRKRRERRFCPQCGSLVERDGYCRYCNGGEGSSPGGSGSDPGVEQPERERDEKITSTITRLLGWALILVAIWEVVNSG